MNKLNTHQAAEYLGLSPGTLVNWRYTKTNIIPHYKFGSRIIYTQEDLDLFQAKCKRDDTITK
ncbi:MAG: helix-turn-helix domain-containing protein [Lentisphaerota bacterium]